MNLKKIVLLTMLLVLLPFTIKVLGNDNGQIQSLFTDIKANRIGDILTVLIIEQSRGTSKSESKSDKSSSADIQGGPGLGKLSFIPFFKAETSNNSSYNGKGENVRNGSLRAKMSVTVVALRENGDLIIQGSRTIGLSGDKETLNLTGTVRQKDITPKNTIDSYLIADAQISYTGKGATNTASRPGLITRFFGWIF